LNQKILKSIWIAALVIPYVVFSAKIFQTSTEETLRSDIGILVSLTGVFIAIFIAIKLYEIGKSRELQEHQHYKERLTYEIQRLIFFVDTIAENYRSIIKNPDQENVANNKRHAQFNRSRAEKNLERLKTINSVFNIPPEIRSKFDNILSAYESVLEAVEHGYIRSEGIIDLNKEYAKTLQDFFTKHFFQERNNEQIDINLQKINESLTRIISKNDSKKST